MNAGTVPGPVVISQPCAISNTLTLKPGVNLAGTGQGNGQVGPPDTFTGGYIFPASNFPTSTALITIGTASAPTTNPDGARLDGICLSGWNGSSYTAGCIGVLVTDTADVHLIGCYLANFDRGGATGTAVYATSGTAGNGVGLEIQNCVISASWQGVYTTGAGVTDMRFSGNLWHSNTEQLTVGASNLGGGGCQITNDHMTYSGMPSTGWHLQMGSQRRLHGHQLLLRPGRLRHRRPAGHRKGHLLREPFPRHVHLHRRGAGQAVHQCSTGNHVLQ